MKIRQVITIARSLLLCKIGKKSPWGVSWALTRRCNAHCVYCKYAKNDNDLNTGQIFEIIDQLYAEGVEFISFTGGEALLRQDIKEIIEYAKANDMFVKINTNGLILSERINDVASVDLIHLSLDGVNERHDLARGAGTYLKVIDAIEAVKKHNIKLIVNTVISKYNVNYLDDILKLCVQYNIKASFQPSRVKVLGEDILNAAQPDPREYKKAILRLMTLKKEKKYKKLILNSSVGLRHIYHWPHLKAVPCYAGIANFRINNKGLLYNCDENNEKVGIDILKHGFKNAVMMLKRTTCKNCWCVALVESNFAMNLNLEVLINYFRR